MTPECLTASEWNNLASLLNTIWLFAPSLIAFALSLLLAHAIIPSLVTSGDLPPAMTRARPLLYLTSLAAFALAFYMAARIIDQGPAIEAIFPRFLI
jgi:hypothetical protein